MPDAGTCRSCNAAILWVKTESGKSMPLDAKSEKRVVIVGAGALESVQVVDTYVSHFSTCPNAAQHRKAR